MPRIAILLILFVSAQAVGEIAEEGTPSAPKVPPGQKRSDKALGGGNLRYWPNRDDRAEVRTASFLGGKGNEYLVDAGFQPGGQLVLVGNAVGGDFQLPVAMRVLGRDGRTPPRHKPVQRRDKRSKAPIVDALGQPQYEKLSWTMDDSTGFVVKLDADCTRILTAARLGWETGVITAAAVAGDGSVYIAGRAEDNAAALSRDSDTSRSKVGRVRGARCGRTFVAKLDADLRTVQWVRVVQGPSFAPRLTIRQDGTVVASLADLRTYSPQGQLLSTVVVDGGLGSRNSVSPTSGEIVYGGEHHWSTGREPWRCPVLDIKHPNGKLRYKLMDWGGPYVGLDNCRLVSDTAVRRVGHDAKGNIVAVLWSDGGNSVGGRQVTDVRRGVGTRGVGLTTAGAGATSFAWLMRIEPKHYQVVGWTLWCSNYGHKANGANIDRTAQAPDGSVCFAGGSAWGLRQTPNRLAASEPGGEYVAVLTPDLTGVRYSSIVPGAGMADVGDRSVWGVATGAQDGKDRAVFLCGASKTGDDYGLVTPTPTTKAIQERFGGGISDGWFVVLDLSKPVPDPQPAKTWGGRMTYRRDGVRAGRGRKGPEMPARGAEYRFHDDFPRWVTVDAEFRHPDPVRFWPNFFYGRPETGRLTWTDSGPKGSFTVKCDRLVQAKGEHDQRILGELIDANNPPTVRLTISSLGDLRSETFQSTDRRGRKRQQVVQYCPAQGVLEIANRRVKIEPKVTFRAGKVVEKSIDKLSVSVWFTLTGRQLGMRGRAADESFDVRISAQAVGAGEKENWQKRRRRR